ncbi:tyrosine-type recombinase/integrase [Desulfococcaceae bacterium HSG7]|nr:tyrosine-type recombinase/integrase [Desulfococcaceae bacterium HSG7]
MATIYKRGKYWWIVYKNESGRRVFKSLGIGDKKEAARQKKHYVLIEKNNKNTPVQFEITFNSWIEQFKKQRVNRVAPATIKKDKIAIRSFQNHIKARFLNEISVIDVENWYSQLLEQKAIATANCLLRHLKIFFNHAVQNNYLHVSPCQNVKPVKESIKKIRILSKDEVQTLLSILPQQWRDLIKVALYTGARCGEICRLKVKDIEGNRLTIESTNQNPTKSRKFRVIPLPKASLPLFSRLTENKKTNNYLLVNPSKNQWKTAWIRRRLKKYCQSANIDCTFHDLRRTYGAWLVMAGADLVTVKENLGHSDISITVKHYTHLSIKFRAEQTDKLKIM